MKLLTYKYLVFVLLVLAPSGSNGEVYEEPTILPVQELGESEDVGPRTPVAFSGDDYFNTNDTSCVIIDGSSMVSENCHEQTEEPTPFTFRKSWDSEVELEALDTPAEFVIIKDGGRHCDSTTDCLSQIKSLRKRSRNKGCDLRENFYLGGDGKVYEGRGWDSSSYWHLNGLRKKSITIQFLGSNDRMRLSPEAIEVFDAAMEIGLWLGKLSKTFRITSFRQLQRESNASEDALSNNPTESERWVSGEELANLWEYTLPGRLRFVFRRQWNASKPTREIAATYRPVEYVAVSEGGDRCYNRSDCISKMRAIQAEHMDDYGDLLDNFYIGDSGEVYEGRGWNFAPHWFVKGLENKYISVRILGSYVEDLPSPAALNSLKLLVQTGTWLGRISPEHRMFSLRQIYNQSVLLGNPLMEIASKWSTWSDGNFIRSTPNSFGLAPFMSRSEWKAVGPKPSLSRNSQPIKYAMIGDGGSRCFSVEQCSTRMRSEQDQSKEQYGDVLDSFYVGDDGVVYEGRGWDTLPFFNTPFFNGSLVTVKFLGSFQSSLPSRPAWLAFLALLDAGIASGKIYSDYKMYSFRHVYNDSSLLGDEITRLFEGMRSWDGQLSLESEDDRLSSGILPIYSLNISTNIPVIKEYPPLTHPLEYVVVGYSGLQCFTHENCRTDVITRQLSEIATFGNLSYNFYVGEDGSVFAGCGWNSTCQWHVRGVKADSIFVTFLGNFQNSLPSRYAILAFNRLIQFGVRTGKFDADYKIISLRQLYPNSSHASVAFGEEVKSWGRWSEYQALSPGGVSIPFGPTAFVPKSQWSARGLPQNISQSLNLPATHLIILDADESCTNFEDCILRVQAEQRRTHPQFGDAMENFYIGEDGRIYEGRGWSQSTQWHSRILNVDFITVAFLGKFRTQPPSSKALAAFEYFYKKGIMEDNLKPDFHIFSLRQFIPSGHIPGEALDKYIRTWDNWSNDTSQAFMTDSLVILSTSVWGRSKAIRRSNKIVHPLKYVYVREGGYPCSSKSQCISRMKTIENENDAITENFYIGGTGDVFEGIGWVYDTKWGYPGWKYSISVHFLGIFESYTPTKSALAAFTALCQHGVRNGYLESDYKILFIPDNYNSKIWVGSKFKELIKTWRLWVPSI